MKQLTQSISYEVIGEIGVIISNNAPVNALSSHVRQGLADGIKEAENDPAVKAVVLHCEGRTFFAGADISEFGKPENKEVPDLRAVIADIESCTKPVIAGVHGTALGGGLETALGCHYRIALPTTKMGLPEVTLGIIPGAGGTVRLPRLMGVQKSLGMITSGSPIGAQEALANELVDEMVDGDIKEKAIEFAKKVVAENRPLIQIRDKNDKLEEAKGNTEIFDAFRKSIARKTRGFKAPEAIIQAVEGTVNLSFDEALENERKLFVQCQTSPEASAQQYFFFAERQANKIPDVPKDTPIRTINKVGIIGAGTMGGGISMNFLNSGIPVTIVETTQEALDRGIGVIQRNYSNTAKKGRITEEDVQKRMSLLHGTLDFEELADVDMVIEAVFEDMDLKKTIFGNIDKICKPGAILASNTSYLNVNEIASATSRPEDVIGTHFFSPANIMKLLEVVRGEKTAKDVIATCMALGKKIGKISVLVGVCHGFVGNRMLAKRTEQSNDIMQKNAMPQDIDRVIYDFGLPMGPFAMADLAGLDIGWMKDKTPDKETNLRHQLCMLDRRGQKTGAGIYDYKEGSRTPIPNPDVEEIIKQISVKMGVTRKSISDEDILKRMIYAMVNEAAKILDEGIALRPSDIDVVWVYGYGWPTYRGGVTYYADQIGLENIVKALEKLAKEYDPRLEPAPLLKKLVSEGKGFKDFA